MEFSLNEYGINVEEILRNTSVPRLYEIALRKEKGTHISDAGALMVYSGKKTGRSPKDKRVVRHPESENNIDWGPINIELDEHIFNINRERAIDYLNTRERIFVVDAFAGWDPDYSRDVRVVEGHIRVGGARHGGDQGKGRDDDLSPCRLQGLAV